MCAALVGGMQRLSRQYVEEAGRAGVKLKVFNTPEEFKASRVGRVDAVVVFTNKVSHRAKKEAAGMARKRNIPLYMYHSCGICTLRDCLKCIRKT